ncbi:hypothetical protein BKA66DRAFT_455047 [Pyrenochaeta sp. MPI-SDFR-AT-0127]|nr:hypothetical protein BKA66DRAFT_455047 [Pyrenochaeta sp. MPI-SDFR-AT-0127]
MATTLLGARTSTASTERNSPASSTSTASVASLRIQRPPTLHALPTILGTPSQTRGGLYFAGHAAHLSRPPSQAYSASSTHSPPRCKSSSLTPPNSKVCDRLQRVKTSSAPSLALPCSQGRAYSDGLNHP